MTLYWWMHWFWITTLKLQVLLAVSGGFFARSASLSSTPIIQNGHQNGPFSNEAPTELVTSISLSSSPTDHEDSYFDQDSVDGFITSLPPLVMVKPLILPIDYDRSITKKEHGVTTSVNNGEGRELFPFKNLPGPHPETHTTQELGTLTYPSLVNEDLTTSTLFKDSPSIAENDQVEDKDLKTVVLNRVPSKIVGSLEKHDEINVGKESLVEDVPMSDGPYNPTGSFINHSHVHFDAVENGPTLKSSGTSASNDDLSVGTDSPIDGKTDEEMKDVVTNTTSENPILLITLNMLNESPSINTRTLGPGAENGNGNSDDNSTVSSAESNLEEDYNSTLVTGSESTFATKTAVVLPVSAQKNKSSPVPENAKSVATFENGHIDESTTVLSILVQSVIDESAISTGKPMDAATITGIAFGAVVIAGLLGAVSFVFYRRRYLNKPQTLNDKCSNPDSSGYIDDSTLRENSEEMYSLDNDSFLNSLEAMTIQNYWTDNVKHTKL